jgi:hypothetical protein
VALAELRLEVVQPASRLVVPVGLLVLSQAALMQTAAAGLAPLVALQ